MDSIPSERELKAALIAAAKTHHEFETNYLKGVRHEHWAWWYAAYLLGHLGQITTPTLLTTWLEQVSGKDDWYKEAVKYIIGKLNEE